MSEEGALLISSMGVGGWGGGGLFRNNTVAYNFMAEGGVKAIINLQFTCLLSVLKQHK